MQDIATKVDGSSTLSAAEFNQIPTELENAITTTGQALSSGDLNQIGKSMASYAAVSGFYTDSGAADAYVLTAIGSYKSPIAYTNGMSIRFKPGIVNTGGAVTVNVASLGVKTIKQSDGTTNPAAGDMAASRDIMLMYDGTVFRIFSPAVVAAASQAQMETGTSTSVVTTPGRQQFHPGHPKFWGYITLSAGTPTLQTSFNVVSIVDQGVGQFTFNFTTNFSSVNYAVTTSANKDNTTASCAQSYTNQAVGSIRVTVTEVTSGGVNIDPNSLSVSGLGDQ